MTDTALSIDVSKKTLDTRIRVGGKLRSRSFANSHDGWRQLICWLREQKIRRFPACLEATGRYSLGIALALHQARSRRQHRQSCPDPRLYAHQAGAQQGVDAAHIRDYAEGLKPLPWTPPSPALRLSELQTIRSGLVAGLTEWKNRNGSGIVDEAARSLAEATIIPFTTQLQAVDQTVKETIEGDPVLHGKRNLLLSISDVGEALAGILLIEMPDPDMLRLRSSAKGVGGLSLLCRSFSLE